jgi:hypothetical protein
MKPRTYTVTIIPGNKDQTDKMIMDYIYDLGWAGGCRHPDDDPMFDSVEVLRVVRSRTRKPTTK